MAFNKIIVLGAGAIGSTFGALLSRQSQVLLVGRKEHVKAVNQEGLRFSGALEEAFKLKAGTEIDEVPERTLLLLTTKAFAAAESLAKVKPLLKDDTVILCLQNGLGVKEEVKEKTGLDVVQGFTYSGAVFLQPGQVFVSALRKTYLEPSEKSEEILETFDQAGLEAGAPENFKEKQWEKFVVNCVLNPLTAIFGVENSLITNRQLDPVKKSIIDECLEVAEAEKVKVRGDFLEYINSFFAHSRNKSSMLQDLENGRKTEIDYLNGKVVKLARKHGLTALTNQKVVRQIKRLEND